MTTILIILSFIAYIIIGRIIMVIMSKRGWINITDRDYSYANSEIFFGAIFFPIVLLWAAMSMVGDIIIKKLDDESNL